jgi:hypothetical protein
MEGTNYIVVKINKEGEGEMWDVHLLIFNNETRQLMEELRELKWVDICIPLLYITDSRTLKNWASAFSMLNPFFTVTVWYRELDTQRFREDTSSLNPAFFCIKPLTDFAVEDGKIMRASYKNYNSEYFIDPHVCQLISSIYAMAVQDDYV